MRKYVVHWYDRDGIIIDYPGAHKYFWTRFMAERFVKKASGEATVWGGGTPKVCLRKDL